jgi:two-component system phosphate regulon sensor histidine kinase PhoR
MARQLNRLERLVDDLSELSRIESGDVALELDNIDLRATVAEVIEDFAEQAAHHRIEFDIRGNRVMVWADPLRIQQAFFNLIDNAIKYGGDGKKVIVEVADENNSGVVRVIDQGEGIPDAERTNVFRRFYRIDKSRSQEIPGSGLGLAIAKHLILQHHGSIDVQSDPGSGATFIVRLPKSEGEPSLHAAGGEGSRR